jgi:hypothetical protein
MSIKLHIPNSYYDFTNETGIVDHPQDWIVYKCSDLDDHNKFNYILCIDYTCVTAGGCSYGMSRYDIISSTDNIIFDISDDKKECIITTDKYKYKFKKTDTEREIKNYIGGIYKTYEIEFVYVEQINKKSDIKEKYYIDFEDNIINFYMDGQYCWSKIISTRYTKGIYFICNDKVFTVIQNGDGILDVFNLDGTLCKKIQTSMDYIEIAHIIFDDKYNKKYLDLRGFIWQPIGVIQYIDAATLLEDKLRQKSYYDHGDDYDTDNFINMDYLINDSLLEYDE